MIRLWICLTLLCWSFFAQAHKPSDSYLNLTASGDQLQGQWHIALRDLDYALSLDDNNDSAITWGELRTHQKELFGYALQRLEISDQTPCSLSPGDLLDDEHSDGHYAVLNFKVDCTDSASPKMLRYTLFFDIDPQHRGLLTYVHANHTNTAIFSPDNQQYPLKPLTGTTPLEEFIHFAAEGVVHIGTGFDHLLFLLSLLLPAALLRVNAGWQAKSGFTSVFWDAATVVTAFTIAHSITLTITALHWIALPARWVESAIAASVIVAALNNIFPRYIRHRTRLAFGFGLIHGMGIAGVLTAMALPDYQHLMALGGFNLGVELGQLLMIAVALPVITWISRFSCYHQWVMQWSSALIAIVAFVWLVERSLDMQLIPSGI
jgi:hypothetical protein